MNRSHLIIDNYYNGQTYSIIHVRLHLSLPFLNKYNFKKITKRKLDI